MKADWTAIDQLIKDQRFAEALAEVETLRAQAEAARASAEWTRALLKAAQLRLALGEFETSVEELRKANWPEEPLARAALSLHTGRALRDYLQAYSWEIQQRERTVADEQLDLKRWTAAQIAAAAVAAYGDAWQRRAEIGTRPAGDLDGLVKNSYPEGIRPTLRDSLTYLFAELLLDSSLWTPRELRERHLLDWAVLLEAREATVDVAAPELHPLAKLSYLFGDLERWHRAAGRREAALEAALERARSLHRATESAKDRAAVAAWLARRLERDRDLAWWAEGMATRAEFARGDGAAQAEVRARELALAGAKAYPKSYGGERCAQIVAQIEAPDFELAAMAVDGPRQRSLELTHRNLTRLHFRAVRFDLEARLSGPVRSSLWPDWREAEALLSGGERAASWVVELPPTPDFRSHRTFVVPPLGEAGAYLIFASAQPSFARPGNRVRSVGFLISDLILLDEGLRGRTVQARALSGASGRPIAGAEVALYRFDWQRPARRVSAASSDAQGLVRLDPESAGGYPANHYLVGRHRGQFAVGQRWWGGPTPEPSETASGLMFTDRALYRPGQKLYWKLLAYEGRPDRGALRPRRATEVMVRLLDANGEVVAEASVRTNDFGTASGEFVIPAGRLLGDWRLDSTAGGSAGIGVEEYKRPTFEVTLDEPKAPLRLNREARFTGAARYYFGLPLSEGKVGWRVTREAIRPWWWGGWRWERPRPSRGGEVVASGTATLSPEGRFEVAFTPGADEREADEPSRRGGRSYFFRLEVDATDAGGETRSADRSFRLGWTSVEARVESEAGFLHEGRKHRVAVFRTDLNGVARPGKGRYRLLRLAQPEVAALPSERPGEAPWGAPPLTPGDRLRPRWQPNDPWQAIARDWPDGDELRAAPLEHAGERAWIELPPLSAGVYRLRYETVDDFGAAVEAQAEFLVAGERPRAAFPALLVAERDRVAVGEQVRLFVHSGRPGQTLIFERFRDGRPLDTRLLVAGEGPTLLEFPATAEDRGGWSARLTAVADHQLLTAETSVFVPWDDRRLEVELTTFRDRLRPGSRETFRVTVKDAQGRPVEAGAAEILAAMYDASLDAFRPHRPADPMAIFPNRSGLPARWTNLGQGPQLLSLEERWYSLPGVRSLESDRFEGFSGYGIGGPGRRGRMMDKMMMAAAPVAQAGRAEGARAPEAEAEQRSQQDGAEETVTVTAETPMQTEVVLRSDFAETAFFRPHLITGADGSAAIEFTVPDSVTAWRFWLRALSRDLAFGSAEGETRSLRELMVRPYLPRFLREGDRAIVKVMVNNASERELAGELRFAIRDPETQADLAAEFGLAAASARRSFRVAAGRSEDLAFEIAAPRRLGPTSIEVTASAGGLADGERRPLPVLPSRVHLIQSRFAALSGHDRRELDFPDLRTADPTRIDEQLVVTIDGQLFYGLLAALPYLADYPYECTEQTLNRFLSTGILASLFDRHPAVARMAKELAARETPLEAWQEDDPNRKLALEETPWRRVSRGGDPEAADWIRLLDPKVARATRDAALARLAKSQLPSGAFPWFPGGPPSEYMTLYLMYGFAKASEFGVEVPRAMVEAGWRYLAEHYRREWRRDVKRNCCLEFVTFLNYVASSYPDPSWMGAALTAAERRELLERSFSGWREHSPMLKLMLAMTLARMDRARDGQLVLASVLDSAKTTRDEGTYWRPEDRSWLWYNDSIETHAMALRAVAEVTPKDPRRHGLVQWLFLNKQLNHWKSTRATAEVLYSVASYLKKEGTLAVPERIRVAAGAVEATFQFDPERFSGKENRLIVPPARLAAAGRPTVVVEKETPGLAFASATWHFSTEQPPAEERGDLFQVSRRYFKRERRDTEAVLVPLRDGVALSPGDEIEIQLSLRSRMPAEYVHLRDPRPAGLEPDRPGSGWRWDLGLAFYEEQRDSQANFFFEQLPPGEYTFRYRLRVNLAGEFRVGPATVQSMYAPEFAAYSAGENLKVVSGGPD